MTTDVLQIDKVVLFTVVEQTLHDVQGTVIFETLLGGLGLLATTFEDHGCGSVSEDFDVFVERVEQAIFGFGVPHMPRVLPVFPSSQLSDVICHLVYDITNGQKVKRGGIDNRAGTGQRAWMTQEMGDTGDDRDVNCRTIPG